MSHISFTLGNPEEEEGRQCFFWEAQASDFLILSPVYAEQYELATPGSFPSKIILCFFFFWSNLLTECEPMSMQIVQIGDKIGEIHRSSPRA